MNNKHFDTCIIGGGFFGLYIAEHFAKTGHEVVLFEKESDFMTRASYNNQARVHNGYHYPRNILTALRSRISFTTFCNEFSSAIVDSFDHYYMIGKVQGKVTAKQFAKFCDRIGAPCTPAPMHVKKLCNQTLIEEVYTAVEYAFDASILKNIMIKRVKEAGVSTTLSTTVNKIETSGKNLKVHYAKQDQKPETGWITANNVFNCTYSMLNYVLKNSWLNLIPLKHEMTEICLVDIPDPLKNIGVTIMCGPFFSFMPFPARKLHSFSHVRYTPHYEWQENDSSPYFNTDTHYKKSIKTSNWTRMLFDAKRYLPILNETKYRDSLFEIKTILPRNDSDDGRPILFIPNYANIKGLHCIMGGKIDNIYDILQAIKTVNIV